MKSRSKTSSSHSNIIIDSRRIINDSTPFGVKEAYRSLYTNIMYLPFESKCKKIVFTSAFPGEGKTSVSINMAYTIAATSPETKILLIDADMRSPRVAKLLGIDTRDHHGLSEYLAGIDEEPTITESIYPNLSIITSGAENTNTPALLSASKMRRLVEYCDANYDYVIIDTPPINIVTDAVFLSEHVDGYVIVTRADYSDVHSVADAISTLEKVEGHILGIVLSSLDSKKMARYGYGRYGKYGRYGGKYGRYGQYGRYGSSKYTGTK